MLSDEEIEYAGSLSLPDRYAYFLRKDIDNGSLARINDELILELAAQLGDAAVIQRLGVFLEEEFGKDELFGVAMLHAELLFRMATSEQP